MAYTQVKKFDQAKAGKIKNFCLRNVRLGYGIPAKYDSAWEAWQNTEQHKDTNYPDGVEIPVYFSYTATIDGVRKNYGHIGVRLKNGKFWSDGVVYAGISAYTKNHAPRYVGWGESVNNVKVIKGDDMYKDKSAKYWRDEYIKYKGHTVTWRTRYEGLFNRVKTALGKYLGK